MPAEMFDLGAAAFSLAHNTPVDGLQVSFHLLQSLQQDGGLCFVIDDDDDGRVLGTEMETSEECARWSLLVGLPGWRRIM